MFKIKKKLVALILSLLISSSIFLTASATSFNNKNITYNFINTTKKVVTLSRYGFDGSISLIKVEIDVNQNEDINDKIEEKCIELLKNDPELQKLFNNNITKIFYSFVISRGRGFHIKLDFPFKWTFNNKKIYIPIIFCRYPNDKNSFTTTISHLNITNTTNGPHSVLCIGFYGFKWWIGRISWSGFLIRKGFIGFSFFTRINNF